MRNLFEQTHFVANEAATSRNRLRLFPEIIRLLRRPKEILVLWNWKAALLSIGIRAPIFVAVTIRRGPSATLSAVITESAFCMSTAGFYGAVVQRLRDAEPRWATLLVLTLVMPAIFQTFEFGLHWLRGTPHLRVAEIVSIFVSGVSALFNWYVMRRGTLLVGGEGTAFRVDLQRLPRLIFLFLLTLPRWIARRMRVSS